MNIKKQINIIIVAGPNDKEYVEKNIKLIDMLNPNSSYCINIIDNQSSTGIKQNNWDRHSLKDCKVIDGVSQDLNLPFNCRGSYQHGQALTNVTNQEAFKSDILIIMDPDFYIIKKGWIEDIVNKISKGKLFIGAPWHPKWWPKYRRFPCVHFMAIDSEYIDNDLLNFMPDVAVRAKKKLVKASKSNLKKDKKSKAERVSIPSSSKSLLAKLKSQLVIKLRLFYRMIIQNTRGRFFIGSSHDTGHFIYKKFKDIGSEKIYLLHPFVNFQKTYGSIIHLNFKLGILFERFFLNKYSYIDSKVNISLKSFYDFDLPDLDDYGWEEFFDEQMPYAFHMRRFNKKNRNQTDELRVLDLVINQIHSI